MGYFSAFMSAAAAYEGDTMSARSAAGTNAESVAIAQMNNQFNSAEAQKSRDFSMEMADTQMQRRVDDLRKAGLNPGLAYTQGGAAAPTGAMGSANPNPSLVNPGASYGSLGGQMASALDLESKSAQIDALKAQANKANTEAGTEIPATVQRIKADTNLTNTQAAKVADNVKMLDMQLAPRSNVQGADQRSTYQINMDNEMALNALKTNMAGQDNEVKMATLNTFIKAQNDQNYAASVGFQNVTNASSGTFGRIMAYLKLMTGSGVSTNTAAQAAGLFFEP